MVSTAEMKAYAAESRAAIAGIEGRLVKWIVAVVGVATAILGALMGFLVPLPGSG